MVNKDTQRERARKKQKWRNTEVKGIMSNQLKLSCMTVPVHTTSSEILLPCSPVMVHEGTKEQKVTEDGKPRSQRYIRQKRLKVAFLSLSHNATEPDVRCPWCPKQKTLGDKNRRHSNTMPKTENTRRLVVLPWGCRYAKTENLCYQKVRTGFHLKKVPTRTGPCCAPSACYPC